MLRNTPVSLFPEMVQSVMVRLAMLLTALLDVLPVTTTSSSVTEEAKRVSMSIAPPPVPPTKPVVMPPVRVTPLIETLPKKKRSTGMWNTR